MDQECMPIVYQHWEGILEAHKNTKHLQLLHSAVVSVSGTYTFSKEV